MCPVAFDVCMYLGIGLRIGSVCCWVVACMLMVCGVLVVVISVLLVVLDC